MENVTDITFEDSLNLGNPAYVDVRSPAEYEEDHAPGAVNIPLFDNQERAHVGTLYKQSGREEAIVKGSEFVGKKLPSMLQEFSRFQGRPMVIYCARGGMRSGSVASLLGSLGMPVYRVIKGYKGYRRYVINQLESLQVTPPVYILQGLTGSGKTEILREMEYSLDLEGLAGHRSSIFGAMGLVQKSQKAFESGIVSRLRELKESPYIIIEGESRKLGNLHIPDSLFAIMKQGTPLLVETALQRRVDIIRDDYTQKMDKIKVVSILKSLTSKLGKDRIEHMLHWLEDDDYDPLIETLLIHYYDPLYSYSINKLEFAATITNADTGTTARTLHDLVMSHINK